MSTLADKWREYARHCFPNAPPQDLDTLEMTFFTGAMAGNFVFAEARSLVMMGDEAGAIELVERAEQELQAFFEAKRKRMAQSGRPS